MPDEACRSRGARSELGRRGSCRRVVAGGRTVRGASGAAEVLGIRAGAAGRPHPRGPGRAVGGLSGGSVRDAMRRWCGSRHVRVAGEPKCDLDRLRCASRNVRAARSSGRRPGASVAPPGAAVAPPGRLGSAARSRGGAARGPPCAPRACPNPQRAPAPSRGRFEDLAEQRTNAVRLSAKSDNHSKPASGLEPETA
jgi:hypothetical protein